MELRASSLLESFRYTIQRTPAPTFHDSCKNSSAYWTWRVLNTFVDTGKSLGGYTVLPPKLVFNLRARRITSRPGTDDLDVARLPLPVNVAWLRDRVFSLEDYRKGHTGMVAAFECAWGSRNPFHVRQGRLNWTDVRTIMGTFSKLAFVKAPIKVMAFTTRQMPESGGDNWEFMINLMQAQAQAMFRYYPVEEEYLFLSWPHGTPTLENFRAKTVRTGLEGGKRSETRNV
jgi:hypothetical protein